LDLGFLDCPAQRVRLTVFDYAFQDPETASGLVSYVTGQPVKCPGVSDKVQHASSRAGVFDRVGVVEIAEAEALVECQFEDGTVETVTTDRDPVGCKDFGRSWSGPIADYRDVEGACAEIERDIDA
jgi:hypothetical protein